MQPMEKPRRWSASHILIALIILAAGGYWVVQTLRQGAISLDPASATTIVHSSPADGARGVAVDSTIVASLKPGHTVDRDSLDAETVRLYRAADGRPVPGSISASAAGDAITFTPAANLEAETRYIFEIRGAKNTAGTEFIPYGISFTTTATAAPQARQRGGELQDAKTPGRIRIFSPSSFFLAFYLGISASWRSF